MASPTGTRSEEHTSELQSPCNLVCPLLLETKAATVTWPTSWPAHNSWTAPASPSPPPHLHAPQEEPGKSRGGPRNPDPRRLLFFLNKPRPPETPPLPLTDPLPS